MYASLAYNVAVITLLGFGLRHAARVFGRSQS